MINMTKQQIIRKMEQRAKAQMKANALQYEIDRYFENYGIEPGGEIFLCTGFLLYTEPFAAKQDQKELLNKIFKE